MLSFVLNIIVLVVVLLDSIPGCQVLVYIELVVLLLVVVVLTTIVVLVVVVLEPTYNKNKN